MFTQAIKPLGLAAVIVLAGCASAPRITVDSRQGTDFANYKTLNSKLLDFQILEDLDGLLQEFGAAHFGHALVNQKQRDGLVALFHFLQILQ